MSKFQIESIRGVIPALLTIFDKNENIDEKNARKVVNHLINKNVHGLYITGGTGLSFLMTHEERKQYAEIVIDEVNGRVPVVVHVGDIGTQKRLPWQSMQKQPAPMPFHRYRRFIMGLKRSIFTNIIKTFPMK